MKKLFLFFLTGICTLSSFSQLEKRISKVKETNYNKKDVLFFAAPVYADLLNESRKKDPYAITSGSLSFNVGFNYCVYFNKYWGFNWGIEYSNYQNTTLYKGTFWGKDTLHNKSGTYYPVQECNYTEKRMIGAVEVPLLARYRNNNGKGYVSFFADAGLKIHIVAVSQFTQKGTSESKGAYPSYYQNNLFVLFSNYSSYGFELRTFDKKEDMKVEKLGLSLFFTTGIKAKLTEFSDLVVSPAYLYALSDLTKSEKEEYENVFGEKIGYKPLKYSQMGLRVGVILKL
jgi:hypothetical protein